ncbi:hypothetical protein ACFO5R_03710 [Halosolutus amylolyticus]|uniref:DUF4013 domain-containing protein n=1 Tax=Halosolutus amylolyticus TaxID=2932267 RepID=A0ABD5PMA7_9EURY|nr:hypothetical protein [Halosolutus amylolyticus]
MVPDTPDPRDGSDGDSPPPGDPGGAPTAAGNPDDSSPHSFPWHVSRVTDRIDAILPLALVPLLTSLLQVGNVQRALDPGSGVSINVEFAFPSPLLDLWTFADPPPPSVSRRRPTVGDSPPGSDPFADPTGSTGATGTGGTGVPIETPLDGVGIPLESVGAAAGAWILLAILAYVAIASVLAAVYVGGLDRRLRRDPAAIVACASEYAPRFVLYNLVAIGAILLLVPFALVSPALIILALPAVVVVGYLFYAVPFLFVVADAPFVEAFRLSYGFAVGERAYLAFGLWHVGVAVVSSIVLSLLVSAGPGGFLLALALAVPLSLVLTAATVSFLRDLVDSAPSAAQ